ncbi:CAP domain-containing protein [Litchfieldia alkalitelluris]|uniref:CAP domain-containing protein n=1 Tax=Litchfieldia alkalitelluris TaxID=304268 RepID=UPI00099836AC|nr:CAP domain-containing protein [Litchfieldia alkalitelluris]
MKNTTIIIVFLFIISSIYFYSTNREIKQVTKDNDSNVIAPLPNTDKELTESLVQNTKSTQSQIKQGILTYIGMSIEELQEVLGEPMRIDPSSYDYDWWVYNEDYEKYLQIGVEGNKVVTIFAIGEQLEISPFKIGQSFAEINKNYSFEKSIAFTAQRNSYRFELNEDERKTRPIIKMGDVFVQLYFDNFTEKLSSVRMMNADTLVKLRPYELIYRGELLSAQELSDKEWKEVERGNEAQILDITNVIRLRHGLGIVKLDEQTSKVAYKHSKDMNQSDYFSHTSPTTGGLANRLAEGEVIYQLAGENIAAMYVDGIAAVEGWLNSEGHRETLLNEKFTHLGVGVFEKHYTQNFVQKWE